MGPGIFRFVGGIVNLRTHFRASLRPTLQVPRNSVPGLRHPAYPRMRSAFGSYIGLRLALAGTWTPPTSMVNSPDAM